MYPVRVDSERFGMDREQLMATLEERRVQTRPIWQLTHHQAPYSRCMTTETPVADRLFEETLCLPCSTSLTESDVQEIVNRIPR